MKKAIKLIVISLLSFVWVTSCSSKTPTPEITSTKITATPFNKAVTDEGVIGDSFKEPGKELTVKVDKISDVTFKEVNLPENGKKFVGVEFTITNNSKKSDYVDNILSTVFTVNTDKSHSIALTIFGTIDQGKVFLSKDQVKAGETRTGWFVFQIPEKSKVYSVQYSLKDSDKVFEWVN